MNTISFGARHLAIEDVLSLAARRSSAELSNDEKFRSRIRRGAEVVESHWRSEKSVYGVNTGVGDSVVRGIPPELVAEFPRNLFTFHGCGMGRNLDEAETRAVLAARLASLCRGCSGVRLELLECLVALIQNDLLPRIPAEGSVGASGDLTPLSYIAAVLSGEREVLGEGGALRSAAEALKQAGIQPLTLAPKEALAVMNGTSVMTGLACLAFARARSLALAASRITALSVLALKGNKSHFDPFLFESKPFAGQALAARRIAEAIGLTPEYTRAPQQRLQDTYALRCAPHVIGVLEDALTWMRDWIETELNSANDNPLVDPDTGTIHHGGNFYGGHIAFAMDTLKLAVAHIADLLDRQVALLVNESTNRGLPSNLTGASPERRPVNHGFKAVHIAISSFTSEALKLTMPASAFSRSTESHNQDKVSLGTIAARDCLRVLELTAQASAGAMLAALQAFDLREAEGTLECSAELRALRDQVRRFSPMVGEDHALEGELRALTGELLSGSLDGK
jgi:histidine ammonia-lyase